MNDCVTDSTLSVYDSVLQSFNGAPKQKQRCTDRLLWRLQSKTPGQQTWQLSVEQSRQELFKFQLMQ
jgi:hypothetical protein